MTAYTELALMVFALAALCAAGLLKRWLTQRQNEKRLRLKMLKQSADAWVPKIRRIR